jgi:tripartite-type tricarboxylate transporter receptor subunit TctC
MHLAGEQFKFATGLNIVHVPFRESAHALTALIGGQIQITFHQLPAVLQQIKAGFVKPIAITSANRNLLVPEVPTIAESGFPNFESVTWFALYAPAKTPKIIINKINLAVNEGFKGEAGKRLQSIGLSPRTSTPEELANLMVKETLQWKIIIDRVGAKLD